MCDKYSYPPSTIWIKVEVIQIIDQEKFNRKEAKSLELDFVTVIRCYNVAGKYIFPGIIGMVTINGVQHTL